MTMVVSRGMLHGSGVDYDGVLYSISLRYLSALHES